MLDFVTSTSRDFVFAEEIRDGKSMEIPVHSIYGVFILHGLFQHEEGPALTFPAGLLCVQRGLCP